MIKAINETYLLHQQNKRKGKIFVSAGTAHCSQTKLFASKESLALFYELLKTVPAIVLCPTIIQEDLRTYKTSASANILDFLCKTLRVEVVPQHILDQPLPPSLRK